MTTVTIHTMLKDLPPTTTTDPEAWDWVHEPVDEERSSNGHLDREERIVAARRRIDRLEFALRAKEAELQSVIDHYELLLDEHHQERDEPSSQPIATLVEAVAGHLR
ncbi:MAG: hypothetical protein ACOC42_01700 [Halobacteriota archaeon]